MFYPYYNSCLPLFSHATTLYFCLGTIWYQFVKLSFYMRWILGYYVFRQKSDVGFCIARSQEKGCGRPRTRERAIVSYPRLRVGGFFDYSKRLALPNKNCDNYDYCDYLSLLITKKMCKIDYYLTSEIMTSIWILTTRHKVVKN